MKHFNGNIDIYFFRINDRPTDIINFILVLLAKGIFTQN